MKAFISFCLITLVTISLSQITASEDIPVLKLISGPYQNGYQHGSELKSEIHELHALWKENLEETYGYPADDIIKNFLESTDFIPAIQKWTPDLLEEIRGISDGSGINFNTTLAFQLVDEMWTNGDIIAKPHHCSSLGLNNYIVDGGTNYIAQNIDVPEFYHGYEVILDVTDPITGSRKFVNTFAGFIGANGLNNIIGVCVNALLDLKSSKTGLPVCCVVRGILEKASFEEAKEFITNIEHASGQNYTIGSRKEIISLECASDLVVAFWPDSSKTHTYHTNTAYANNSFKDAYTSRIREQFQAEPEDIHYSSPRFELIAEEIKKTTSMDAVKIKTILAEPPVFNKYTWLSTIMEFKDGSNVMYIAPRGKADHIPLIISN